MSLSYSVIGKISPMPEDDKGDLIIRKLGELQADFAKFIATLNLLSPVRMDELARTNRRLLFILIGLVIAILVILAVHLSFSAGLLPRG